MQTRQPELDSLVEARILAVIEHQANGMQCTRCGQTGHRASHCPWPTMAGGRAC